MAKELVSVGYTTVNGEKVKLTDLSPEEYEKFANNLLCRFITAAGYEMVEVPKEG